MSSSGSKVTDLAVPASARLAKRSCVLSPDTPPGAFHHSGRGPETSELCRPRHSSDSKHPHGVSTETSLAGMLTVTEEPGNPTSYPESPLSDAPRCGDGFHLAAVCSAWVRGGVCVVGSVLSSLLEELPFRLSDFVL